MLDLLYFLLQVENSGSGPVSDVLVSFPKDQAKNIVLFIGATSEWKGKTKVSTESVTIKAVQPEGMPPSLVWYALSLPKELGKGESVNLDLLTVFTHLLKPFPEKITQAENQLVVFQDSAYLLSPYLVKVQSLTLKLPEAKVESYTKMENSKLSGSDIKYGPYENVPALQFSPIAVHFVSNHPFPVAEELVREIEISHWGNIQITEHYNLIHGGAQSTGEFSR